MKRYSRRRFLRDSALGLAAAPLAGCNEAGSSLLERLGLRPAQVKGGFVGQAFERGHLLRKAGAIAAPAEVRDTEVIIVGSGIGGLAAARALRETGVSDYRILELEDQPGGNSRSMELAGYRCPLGAHYLCVPGPHAGEVAELLTELRIRRLEEGRAVYDETTLCQSPQERLFIDGRWQEGIVPLHGQGARTLEQYARFENLVKRHTGNGDFTIPTAAANWNEDLAALDRIPFAQWLDEQKLDTPALRWYLDYCCLDDYGAATAQVSAWAGLHYFACRDGFHFRHGDDSPGTDADDVLTWPEGNAWLMQRLAAPHAAHTLTGQLAVRVTEEGERVHIDTLDLAGGKIIRWRARRAILAVPLFIATRLFSSPPAALAEAARNLRHAPWLVANLHIGEGLRQAHDQPPLSWDNVVYGGAGLGYVNAMNQSTRPYEGETVLTYYRALGNDDGAGRKALLENNWEHWRDAILADLAPAHPDLAGKLREVQIMRYGHAMAIPGPGRRGDAQLAALREPQGRIAFAHSDLSAYSIFEEAFHWGLKAGRDSARAERGAPRSRKV